MQFIALQSKGLKLYWLNSIDHVPCQAHKHMFAACLMAPSTTRVKPNSALPIKNKKHCFEIRLWSKNLHVYCHYKYMTKK